ncbi:MAG: hypothetical protein Ct9H300mP27_01180 [Chloroflexota bacterium]|nr:MAG: hypothetical protein Ct9H300mP27_01180 [Chloroflexota bacterium]
MGRLFRLINSQSISMGSLTGLIGVYVHVIKIRRLVYNTI